jgi:glucose 1-dehydrogenase
VESRGKAQASCAGDVGMSGRLLEDEHIVVTGAASGIGAAIAQMCVEHGARVTCADIDGARVQSTVAGLERAGEVVAVKCDISDERQVEQLLDSAIRRFGDVHGLAANAGGAQGAGCSFLDMTSQTWEAMLRRNLTGPFLCGLIFGRHMAVRGNGSIVYTTSNTSEIAIAGLAHYAAAKGGVRQLVRSMAVELAPYGVRVNAVAPGATRTPGNQDRMDDAAIQAALLPKIPMGRVGQPAETAGAIVYLLSKLSTYTTGASIAVDGGYTVI